VVVLTRSGSKPYDVSNDVTKSAILKFSNDDICGTGRPINFVFDSTSIVALPACVWLRIHLSPEHSFDIPRQRRLYM